MRVSSFAHRRSGVASDGDACGLFGWADAICVWRRAKKRPHRAGAGLGFCAGDRGLALGSACRGDAKPAADGAGAAAGE